MDMEQRSVSLGSTSVKESAVQWREENRREEKKNGSRCVTVHVEYLKLPN